MQLKTIDWIIAFIAVALPSGTNVMDHVDRLRLFVRASELGGFSKAAAEAGAAFPLVTAGFTKAEVSGVVFAELGIVVLLAQPLGWLIGHGIGLGMVAAFSSDLYRVPFIMQREVYATASLVVLAAALVSAVAIRGRINNLDMIEVLKTRE